MKKILLTTGIVTGLGVAMACILPVKTALYARPASDLLQVSGEDSLRKKRAVVEKEIKKKEMEISKAEIELKKKEEALGKTNDEKKLMELEEARMDLEMKIADKEMLYAGLEIEEAALELNDAMKEMEETMKELALADLEIQEANEEMKKAGLEMQEAQKEMEKANAEMEEFNALHTELLTELKKTTGEEILSYELDAQTLTVNGKKQPESLHQRLSPKYLKGHKSMSYQHDPKTGRTNISIKDED